MSKERKNYSKSQIVSLLTQVDGICPLCTKPLFYRKNNRDYNKYNLAHIYPLNPTDEEIELLKNEDRLSIDVNHEDNLVPLCLDCHEQFDKPRTLEEYRNMYNLKKELIKQIKQKSLWSQYPIEDDIIQIIEYLNNEDMSDIKSDITYEVKKTDEKFDDSLLLPTKRKIKNNVNDYYQFIKERFISIESENPNATNLISTQIKLYYQKQKSLGLTQQEIFANIVEWLFSKTKSQSKEAPEIIVSFFVQNCEVFE